MVDPIEKEEKVDEGSIFNSLDILEDSVRRAKELQAELKHVVYGEGSQVQPLECDKEQNNIKDRLEILETDLKHIVLGLEDILEVIFGRK